MNHFLSLIVIAYISLIHSAFARDISTYQPRVQFQDLFNIKKIKDGPNCFNFALYSSNLVSTVRFVDGQELLYRLKHNNCKVLQDLESIQKGDIRVIFQRSNKHSDEYLPYHAQVYLNKDTIIEKSGMSRDHPYRIIPTPIAGILNSSNDEILRSSICSRSSINPQECFSWVNIYRCSDKSTHLNMRISNQFSSFYSYLNEVLELEKFVEKITLGESNETIDSYSVAKEKLDILLSLLKINRSEIATLDSSTQSKAITYLSNDRYDDVIQSKVIELLYTLRGIDFQLMQIRYPQNSSKPPSPLIL